MQQKRSIESPWVAREHGKMIDCGDRPTGKVFDRPETGAAAETDAPPRVVRTAFMPGRSRTTGATWQSGNNTSVIRAPGGDRVMAWDRE